MPVRASRCEEERETERERDERGGCGAVRKTGVGVRLLEPSGV